MSNLLAFPQQSIETYPLAAASGEPRPTIPRRTNGSQSSPQPVGVTPLANSRQTRGPAIERRTIAAVPPPAPCIDEKRLSAIAASVGQAAVEVLGGSRPLKQMSQWLDPKSFERLQIRTSLVDNFRRRSTGKTDVRLHRGISVRSTRLCQVREGAYEASLVVAEQSRVRAVALRLELRRGNWKVTALEIG
ncbi:Rv3235 family protein [Arthrobacter roseus]|uniref:Rv3235 family protein n=1 Tax=Arthrobacter roseus TaxID=136274 RepID=UPI001963712C|nr:Rv3235 family protein [Arthrobacter roseus]MBM7849108.1 hypothetical protein [Arthrobacter roseus]